MGLTLSSFGFQDKNNSGGGGGGGSIVILSQGSLVSSNATSIDFTGSYISASAIGGAVSVSVDGSSFLQKNGSVQLTANWDVGSYDVTSNKFIGNNGFGFNVGLGGSLVSASTSGSAKTWTLPNTTGTIALTSDIPSLSGYVKADGSIPLTANWNVGAYEITANKFIGNNGFGFNVGLGGSLVSASTSGSAKTWTLPNATGTIALTSDIPSVSGYLKADGSVPLTANWNVGAYEITANKFIGNNGFGFNVGLGGSLVSASTSGSVKTWTLPNITGTIALIDSPAFSGTPTAPTPTTGDNTTKIATTQFVTTAIGSGTQFGTVFSQTNFNFLT